MLFETVISHPLASRFMQIAHQGLYMLLPPICLLCLHPTERPRNLCRPCQDEMPSLAHSCRKCAQFLHGARITPLCGNCLKESPPFDRTHALGPYQQPLPYLITGLKFNEKLEYARALGELMADAIKERWYASDQLPEAIIPVPLHKSRLRERGFNQAMEIGRTIKRLSGIPIDWRLVERIKQTKPQSSLKGEERIRNVSGAFRVCGEVRYKHVAVLDDVMTTGETLRVLCWQLKRQGVERIDLWVCARR